MEEKEVNLIEYMQLKAIDLMNKYPVVFAFVKKIVD